MSMFTLSLTRQFDFDNIVMLEPVKHLRIKINKIKYGPQMCVANKLTDEVELVLLRNE